MGVPELLKFVAKTAPSALFKVPKLQHQARDETTFDFVLVDATNIAQTIGFPILLDFLTRPSLKVTHAIIFVLDSQRKRTGYRDFRTHIVTQDIEVSVRKVGKELQTRLAEIYASKGASSSLGRADDGDDQNAKKSQRCEPPAVLLCDRNIDGEADYKMLHIHRMMTTAAFASSPNKALPNFLMISEDSDVLCGALCGPAPQNVTLGTTLRDTTLDMCLLKLVDVLSVIGQSADVLRFVEPVADVDLNAKTKNKGQAAQIDTNASKKQQQQPEAKAKVEPETVEPQANVDADDEEAGRRKKKEGPMIATGTKIKLDDSDSDEEESHTNIKNNSSAVQSSKPQQPEAVVQPAILSEQDLSVAAHLRAVCVDYTFLFTIIMGNSCNVHGLVRGATKVDMQTCWNLYCQKKFTPVVQPYESSRYYGKPKEFIENQLLTVATGSKKNDFKAYIELNGTFLHDLLMGLNYSDHLSRPPVPEERERATRYLQKAVGSTLRYVLGCHVAGAPQLQVGDKSFYNFLDTRDAGNGEDEDPPSLAAIISVLADEQKHVFSVSMRGDAKIQPANAAPASFIQPPDQKFGARFQPRGMMSSATSIQNQSDIDGTLIDLATSNDRTTTLATLLRMGQWKTLSSFVEDCTKSSPSSRGLFERISDSWDKMTASQICKIKEASRQLKKNGNPTETSYSFELRRMAPTLSTNVASSGAAATASAEARNALLKAAGISFGYSVAPSQPVSQTTNAFQRDHKGQTREFNKSATTPSAGNKGDEQPDKSTSNKKRRLGKKEREKLARQRQTETAKEAKPPTEEE